MKNFLPKQPVNQAPPQGRPPQGQPQQSGGGFPWGKVLAGCGCLTLVAVLVGGGLMWWGFSKVKEVGDEAGITELLEEGSSGSSGSSGATSPGTDKDGKQKGDAKKRAREARDEALSHEKLRTYIREPLTKKDINEYREFVEEWRENDAYKNWTTHWEALKERGKAEDKDSMAGQLKTAGQTAKTMSAMQSVWKAYDQHVRDQGGYEEHFGRMTRIGGLMAAADGVAKTNKFKDANSDKVAKKMLDERPEVAKQYKKNIADARAAAKKARESGDKDAKDMAAMQGMMSLVSNPGALAMARMPEESFETWSDLSKSDRKELRELMKTSIAPGPYFGMAFGGNPGTLLVAAYMSELKEINNPGEK
ncbi:MAG: hypothetical protein ACQEVA_03560 [Myxococcota bacterium]